jgi:deoxyribodipyrimidine photo-lyase
VNAAPVRGDREYVLYWMVAARRVRHSPALERAVALARELARPLVVLEPLRCDFPFASDRLHAFLLAGMADTARRLATRPVTYHPHVERAPGEGRGLLAALAARACAVVTDDFPTFFLPAAVEAAARALDVRLEAVDGSALVPFRLAGKDFPSAHAYRRFLQGALPSYLERLPAEDPLARVRLPRLAALPREVLRRWPAATAAELGDPAALAASLPVDHRVPATRLCGGAGEGERRLRAFVNGGLARYAGERASPDARVTSGLSPWLHFGHLSSFEVARAVLDAEGFTPWLVDVAAAPPPVAGRSPAPPPPRPTGARAGWWGLSAGAEAFLDQLVTWRELGFVTAAQRPDHRDYASLPEWARRTLAAHRRDRRPALYRRADLEGAATGDAVWNAAQRQLVRDGVLHNALRMIWGKRILEWTRAPEEALEVMLELNDRWALDGRDPNSVSGIFWCLGRYDRPWGPERPVFGTVRYMSSERLRRKVEMEGYLREYGG